jgi:hypothetical protein
MPERGRPFVDTADTPANAALSGDTNKQRTKKSDRVQRIRKLQCAELQMLPEAGCALGAQLAILRTSRMYKGED